jgi:hypothetical protein
MIRGLVILQNIALHCILWKFLKKRKLKLEESEDCSGGGGGGKRMYKKEEIMK